MVILIFHVQPSRILPFLPESPSMTESAQSSGADSVRSCVYFFRSIKANQSDVCNLYIPVFNPYHESI